jgi:hypothetical protein
VPFLKELQAKSVPSIVDLNKEELGDFMSVMKPHGLFLWIETESEEEELEILNLVSKWA